jgi:predicted RNA binding protein YcfA (HicA-like mRNA interferase family)
MPKLQGINHLRAVTALRKAGFVIIRQGQHLVMSDGIHLVTLPHHNPINAINYGRYCSGCRIDQEAVF